MSETLSFPGLGLEFDMDRVAFTVFGNPIYWYGILIAAAFLLGAVYVLRRVKDFGLDGDRVMDVILGGVLLGIVGARLYYVLFSWDTYRDDLLLIFNIRQGGIAIYGGVIGAVLAAVLMCRWRKVRLLPLLDVVAGGLLLGQAVGRWGNFVNIEAFGSNTAAVWGMTSPSIQNYLMAHKNDLAAIGAVVDPSMPVHPTFFYESVWCLLGFAFVAWFTKRRRFDGELWLIYIGWYGLGRFFIEGLRTDPLLIGSIRVSQLVALLCVIASVLTLVVLRSRIKRSNDPSYLPLYVNTEEGQAVLAGEFYKKSEADAEKEDESSEEGEAEDGDAPDEENLPEETEPDTAPEEAESSEETAGKKDEAGNREED